MIKPRVGWMWDRTNSSLAEMQLSAFSASTCSAPAYIMLRYVQAILLSPWINIKTFTMFMMENMRRREGNSSKQRKANI